MLGFNKIYTVYYLTVIRLRLKWTTVSKLTYLIAIKNIGQFICSQFCVRADIRTCPAHSHLPCRDCLKLKVPLPLGDSIRLLCPEDAYLVPAGVLEAMASCSKRRKRAQIRLRRTEILVMFLAELNKFEFSWHCAFKLTYCSPDLEVRCCSHSQ